ncbi:MAG TPA: hypothetical protein VHJ34_06435 [Actinomycetota bacterium]|nr:hypothetical protein [Actinomycetota bacterium]
MTPMRAVVAAVLATAATASCGADQPQPPTRAEFVARAESACRRHATRFEELEQPRGERETVRYVEQVAAINHDVLRALGSLEVPSGEAGAVERVLAGLRRLERVQAEYVELARAGDFGTAERLTREVEGALAEFEAAATAYGLDGCARAVPAP